MVNIQTVGLLSHITSETWLMWFRKKCMNMHEMSGIINWQILLVWHSKQSEHSFLQQNVSAISSSNIKMINKNWLSKMCVKLKNIYFYVLHCILTLFKRWQKCTWITEKCVISLWFSTRKWVFLNIFFLSIFQQNPVYKMDFNYLKCSHKHTRPVSGQ